MHYIISILILTLSTHANKLIEFETKQAVNNLRYVSSDGKVTYYQNRSGNFSFSSNYKNSVIFKNPKNTQYSVFASSIKKKILLTIDKTYYTKMDFNELKDIYILDYGKTNAKKIGKGVSPKLHLEDNFVSFYNPKSLMFTLYNTKQKTKKEFKVFNTKAPFFRPDMSLITSNETLFNDLNESDEAAILNYSFISKKYKPVFKSKFKSAKLEFCLQKKKVIVLEVSSNNLKPQTNIYTIDLFNNQNYKKKNLIYSSILNDVGNLICREDSLYFIKTIDHNAKLNSKKTDIAKINIKTNILKRFESDLNPTQILEMDELILTLKNGKYYIVKGNNNTVKNDVMVKDNQ